MSTLRLLISDLAARPDSSLLRLLSLRPELMDPPAGDFAALATRASSRAGLARALDRLNLPQLQVLTALVVVANPESGATAGDTAEAVSGATDGEVAALLGQLHELALVLHAPQDADDAGPLHFLPLTSLREVLGAHPAGLGRSYAELAAAVPGCRDRLTRVVAALGNPPAGDPGAAVPAGAAGPAGAADETDPAVTLHNVVAGLDAPGQLLDGAPEGTTELLAKFGHGPMGRVGHALRDLGPEPDGGVDGGVDGGAVQWLLRRGLLIPLDKDHVELPREVGLLLRGGRVVTGFAPAPPSAPVDRVRATLRDNAAMGAVASVLRTMAGLLDSVARAPLATLRAGGVGVRAVRSVARDLGVEMAQSYFYLELAAMARLITLDPDTSAWMATDSDWRQRDRAAQWLWLASAWLDAGRLPSLVGTGSPTVNVLAGEAFRPDAPALRHGTLAVLATLGAPAAPASAGQPGMVPAPGMDQVLAHYTWHHPRPARRIARALSGFLDEAEIMGLTGAGALTDLGLAVIDRDWEAALAFLRESLPRAVEHVLLQGDLTAVAPGFLSPELSAELSLLAEPEGRGAAGVYRFTPASIQRSLAAGRSAAGILDFLATHSPTPVPQPLEYLVNDAAARHGRFTVGAATTYISAGDPALLAELLADGAVARLGLTAVAPTLAVSALSAAEVAEGLRAAGHSPALAGGAATPAQEVGRLRRPGAGDQYSAFAPYEAAGLFLAGAEEMDVAGAGAALDPAALQLGLLRSRPAWSPGHGESAPALVREQLQRAIRTKADVWLTTVGGDGRPERLRLRPVTLVEGRVRAFDPQRDSERVFSIHRVMDVELIATAGTGTEGTS